MGPLGREVGVFEAMVGSRWYSRSEWREGASGGRSETTDEGRKAIACTGEWDKGPCFVVL